MTFSSSGRTHVPMVCQGVPKYGHGHRTLPSNRDAHRVPFVPSSPSFLPRYRPRCRRRWVA